jgi:hypothetical protein
LDEQGEIGVVAPASRMSADVAVRWRWPDVSTRTGCEIFFTAVLRLHGHFAGDDETRARAFLDIASL